MSESGRSTDPIDLWLHTDGERLRTREGETDRPSEGKCKQTPKQEDPALLGAWCGAVGRPLPLPREEKKALLEIKSVLSASPRL